MASGGRASGNRELSWNTKINIEESKKRLEELKKSFSAVQEESKKLNQELGKAGNSKPLSEYQAGLLKIKQETLDLAKAKAEQAKVERSASMAIQNALREESKLKREQIAAEKALQAEANKRKPTQISNSQAEIDAYKKASTGSILYTSAINAERVARAQSNLEAAKQAIANGTLTNSIQIDTTAKKENTEATKLTAAAKRQLAIDLAAEKLRQADATKEIKNNAREQLNAKGSLEQRRAALIRLTTVYDRLNKAERESSAGKRLESIIKGLVDQISALESATGRAQRGVGGYADGIAAFFNSIKQNILSTLGPIALLTAAFAAAKEAFHIT